MKPSLKKLKVSGKMLGLAEAQLKAAQLLKEELEKKINQLKSMAASIENIPSIEVERAKDKK